MKVTAYRKGNTIKTVTVAECPDVTSDSAVLDLAMAYAGESRSSLFGWNINYFDEYDFGITAVVDLHTD